MKQTILIIVAACFLVTAYLSYANTPERIKIVPVADGVRASVIERPEIISGLITKNDGNLVLVATTGSFYLLKGLNLHDSVGEVVDITGVVRNNKETSALYVIKADVKR